MCPVEETGMKFGQALQQAEQKRLDDRLIFHLSLV
jgi:hypothetical protein